MDEEYLKLFQKQNEQKQEENLNETVQPQTWENLSKPRVQQNQWQNLNETPNTKQYNVNENVNDGWGTLDVQVETRVNGVVQNNPNQQQMRPNPRRHQQADPNGLNQFMEDDLREVVRQPAPQQPVQPAPLAPPPVQDVKDVDVVSVDMFENMGSNAMITFANGKLASVDPKKVTNNAADRKVTFLKS